MTDKSVGIMDPAYFISKNLLIKWVNDFLKINIKKIEEMANGAYHCQLLDAIFPGKVPLHKVNFNAKHDYEYVKNFKVLQDVFTQQEVKRHVEVAKLVNAKYQDNLEFCQWMKSFVDQRYDGRPYNAVAAREAAIKAYGKGHKHAAAAAPAAASAPAPAASAPTEKKTAAPVASKPDVKAPAKKPVSSLGGAKPAPKPAAAAVKSTPAAPAAVAAAAAPAAAAKPAVDNSKEIEELNGKLSKLRLTIEGLEKERNFYFGKLRQIEVLCQQDETKDAETKEAILKILYHTDDEEFQPADGATAAAAAAPTEAAAEAAPAEHEAAADGDLVAADSAHPSGEETF